MNEERVAKPTHTSQTVSYAKQSQRQLEAIGRLGRASMLDDLADRFADHAAAVVRIAAPETNLPTARLETEVGRVSTQFRLFAQVLRDGAYLGVAVDSLPSAGRIVRMNMPLGVVAVFGASNFPLAFSVPGGDVAAALAAGCSVVVKVHPLHPKTAEVCAGIIHEALEAAGVPRGALGLIYGYDEGMELVKDPDVAAVAFTGSRSGGSALRAAIDSRPDPIPFYGELGSVNPAVVLPGAAAERGFEIGRELGESIVFSQGQLCTRSGMVLIPSGDGGDSVIRGLTTVLESTPGGRMLGESILSGYLARIDELSAVEGVTAVAKGTAVDELSVRPMLFTAGSEALDLEIVREEVFGPCAVVVRFADLPQAFQVIEKMDPALAASIYFDAVVDREEAGEVSQLLQRRVGRVVFNGVTTGVSVNWAQNHAGPWPASTTRFTSVGAAAIERFIRAVSWQDPPDWILPEEVTSFAVPQRVEGQLRLPS